jgi:hypothetical protein
MTQTLLLVNARISSHRAQDNASLGTIHLQRIPGLNCNSSRTGLGSTIRPALSIVTVVAIVTFCQGIWHCLYIRVAFSCAAEPRLRRNVGNLLPSCNVMHVLIYRWFSQYAGKSRK